MNKSFLLLVAVLFMMFSCVEKQTDTTQANCYFQYEYVNYAWGFQHSGFMITPEREVYSFSKSTPWVFPKEGKLSLADLKKNIAASVKVDTIINNSDLEYYKKLASAASLGNLSLPVSQGADMGSHGSSVLIPDPNGTEGSYLQVVLSENGDVEQHNLAPEAAVIAAWLENLGIH